MKVIAEGRLAENQLVFVCGGPRSVDLARKLRSPVLPVKPPVTILSERSIDLSEDMEDVTVIRGDATSADVLKDAGIESAGTAIVLSDLQDTGNADALSLLVALAIEDICPEIFTIVEVTSTNNIPHFDRTAVNATVCRAELSQLLMAQTAISNHISDIYRELFDFQTEGNEIYRVPARKKWDSFGGCFRTLINERVIPIGLRRDGKNLINPGADTVLQPDDELWVIAVKKPF
ncbi:MAG: TrkA family potassium uptake protein [Planctomycetes bacterium]|nr:TrkA family potassium uptake protein [Planctomycetota bacterium]